MRTIKRYSNRKLYDTVDKRYITLQQIAELVREGQDIRVIENQTGQDLTNVTLSQILLEQEKKQTSNIPKSFFTNLIQRSSTSVVDFMRKNVLTYFDTSFLSDDKIDENVNELVERGELEQEEATLLKDEIKTRSQTFRERLDELVEKRVDVLLTNLHIPTKGEVAALHAKIDDLSQQLDALGAPAAKPAVGSASPTAE
jgi:polyhydroxyalkanoate synthesis repressor PhaR